jgi:stearoyl-CoA desaturase (delta-9 desaturase)
MRSAIRTHRGGTGPPGARWPRDCSTAHRLDLRGAEHRRRPVRADIRADVDLARISRWFPAWVTLSLLLPALLGGLITWSWLGALTAFFWAGLVRIAFLHHVTWSINSICHVFGKRPFKSRDLSSNVAWLAIPASGESWHNLHHAEPTAARHGVLKGQVDPTAPAADDPGDGAVADGQ